MLNITTIQTGKNYFSCEGCGHTINIINSKLSPLKSHLCTICYEALCFTCKGCGENGWRHQAYHTGDGDDYCPECFSKTHKHCKACEQAYEREKMMEVGDNFYCTKCTPLNSIDRWKKFKHVFNQYVKLEKIKGKFSFLRAARWVYNLKYHIDLSCPCSDRGCDSSCKLSATTACVLSKLYRKVQILLPSDNSTLWSTLAIGQLIEDKFTQPEKKRFEKALELSLIHI